MGRRGGRGNGLVGLVGYSLGGRKEGRGFWIGRGDGETVPENMSSLNSLQPFSKISTGIFKSEILVYAVAHGSAG